MESREEIEVILIATVILLGVMFTVVLIMLGVGILKDKRRNTIIEYLFKNRSKNGKSVTKGKF